MNTYDLQICQGATYNLSFNITDVNGLPIDLTNLSISGFLRCRYSDSGILANLNPQIQSPPTSGIITLNIPATGTSVLPITIGVYDVFTYSGVIANKILRGNTFIYPEATY